MNSKFSCRDIAEARVISRPVCMDSFKMHNPVEIKCYDKDGNLKWEELNHNFCTDEGMDLMLNVMFHGTAAIGTWYVGLAGAGTKAITNTLASHAAWTEVTAYAGTRPAFVEGAASGKSISNAGNVASYTMNGSATVAGAFLASVTSGTSGTMFAVVDFATPRSVASTDIITVQYTLSGADT